nr:MAG TPA: cytochrome c-552 [Caudoviricetes sp.]
MCSCARSYARTRRGACAACHDPKCCPCRRAVLGFVFMRALVRAYA